MKIGSFPVRWWWILPAIALILLLALLIVIQAERQHSTLPILGQLPQFTLTDQNGLPFGRYNMIGHVSVVSFIFTTCKEACPIMGNNMIQVYRDFKSSGKVQCISITVDPDHDSLATLRDYAKSWGVDDNGWVFLRGQIDSVIWLCEKGFMMIAENLPEGHTTRFTLVDAEGQIRGYYDGLDSAAVIPLERDIKKLLAK
jgi:cytochrome oxidase Cu insertion factor (SCO1/SenC/PrrC family)